MFKHQTESSRKRKWKKFVLFWVKELLTDICNFKTWHLITKIRYLFLQQDMVVPALETWNYLEIWSGIHPTRSHPGNCVITSQIHKSRQSPVNETHAKFKFLHFSKSCPQVPQWKKDAISRGSAAAATAAQEHAMIASITTAGNHSRLAQVDARREGGLLWGQELKEQILQPVQCPERHNGTKWVTETDKPRHIPIPRCSMKSRHFKHTEKPKFWLFAADCKVTAKKTFFAYSIHLLSLH